MDAQEAIEGVRLHRVVYLHVGDGQQQAKRESDTCAREGAEDKAEEVGRSDVQSC